jgi:hypothetical protein
LNTLIVLLESPRFDERLHGLSQDVFVVTISPHCACEIMNGSLAAVFTGKVVKNPSGITKWHGAESYQRTRRRGALSKKRGTPGMGDT